MPTVYLATCSYFPDGDLEDGAILLAAARRAGLDASWQVWDDPTVDWAAADLVVIRSTWDYTARAGAFLDWVEAVPRLANPKTVVHWNSNKVYLRDLAEAGVPVVPTTWAPPGIHVELPTRGEFVVKPSVGAGSRGAARFDAAAADTPAAARAHLESLHAAGRTAMVQPYLGDVDEAGETALIYLGGTFSHAIRKGAMLPADAVNAVDADALYLPENISARRPGAAEMALGERALGVAIGDGTTVGDLLYARVDLLPTDEGPVVIELELVEPSLFLSFDDAAPDRLAQAIVERLAHPPNPSHSPTPSHPPTP